MNHMNLSQIPLFEGLSDDQLQDLSSIAITKTYKRGAAIFSDNDPGAGFYVVSDGKIKIFKISGEGKEQIYGTQLRTNEKSELELAPLFEPATVDERRQRMGLGPLKEYMELVQKQLQG